MTQEELEKKAEDYAEKQQGVFRFLSTHIIFGFLAGAKEMQEENAQLKQQIKEIREKLFDILSDYEIGNYAGYTHLFYKHVYKVHNALMEVE